MIFAKYRKILQNFANSQKCPTLDENLIIFLFPGLVDDRKQLYKKLKSGRRRSEKNVRRSRRGDDDADLEGELTEYCHTKTGQATHLKVY